MIGRKLEKLGERTGAIICLSGLFTKNAVTSSYILRLPKFKLERW